MAKTALKLDVITNFQLILLQISLQKLLATLMTAVFAVILMDFLPEQNIKPILYTLYVYRKPILQKPLLSKINIQYLMLKKKKTRVIQRIKLVFSERKIEIFWQIKKASIMKNYLFLNCISHVTENELLVQFYSCMGL